MPCASIAWLPSLQISVILMRSLFCLHLHIYLATYHAIGKVFSQFGIEMSTYSSWQSAQARLQANASGDGGNPLAIEYTQQRTAEGTSSNPPPLSLPKEGKWDDENNPHVGGNTWAGGTGGSNTAGLGGRGGPYRLDRS